LAATMLRAALGVKHGATAANAGPNACVSPTHTLRARSSHARRHDAAGAFSRQIRDICVILFTEMCVAPWL
jgi:hypothetical protein